MGFGVVLKDCVNVFCLCMGSSVFDCGFICVW